MIMGVADALVGIAWAAALIALAKLAHRRLPLVQTLFIPSSIVAGLAALLVGPQVLGRLLDAPGVPDPLSGGLVPEAVLDGWAVLPALLINVVFAGLFLGKRIPSLRDILRLAGPQVALGQTLAWGQYVIGILLAALVLSPVFGLPVAAGALIEIGFEGGHGTAAALAGTFEEFGFAEGADLALGLATIGLIAGVLIGLAIINWGVRSGRIDPEAVAEGAAGSDDRETREQLAELDEREPPPLDDGHSVDPLAVHLGFIALAIGVGWVLREGLIALESATWARDGGLRVFLYVPLFPLAMIGGLIVQLTLDRFGAGHHVDRALANRISGAALDLVIVAALGTLSLTVIGQYLVPLLILAVAGLAWCVGGFLLLAPRIVPSYPYQRGLADFGQSTGMTVTGLLLVRVADPGGHTRAVEGFGYKQLLFEPFVGGGIFTAVSVPLLAQLGPWPVLAVSSLLLAASLGGGLWYARVLRRRSAAAAGSG